jgi:hypothetical protein
MFMTTLFQRGIRELQYMSEGVSSTKTLGEPTYGIRKFGRHVSRTVSSYDVKFFNNLSLINSQ